MTKGKINLNPIELILTNILIVFYTIVNVKVETTAQEKSGV